MPRDQFYGIDTTVHVPHVAGTWCNATQVATRMGCTRLAGHTGRHAATAGRRAGTGLRPVFEVWAEPEVEVAEPCS